MFTAASQAVASNPHSVTMHPAVSGCALRRGAFALHSKHPVMSQDREVAMNIRTLFALSALLASPIALGGDTGT